MYVRQGLVKLTYCPTRHQLADIFTKSLPGHKLRTAFPALGLGDSKVRRRVESDLESKKVLQNSSTEGSVKGAIIRMEQ
jgi:hypothetical protein